MLNNLKWIETCSYTIYASTPYFGGSRVVACMLMDGQTDRRTVQS